MAEFSLQNKKVLVVDDDELIRLTVKVLMKKYGCQLLEAQDGNEGVAAFKKENPDLVMTDILMPNKEGLTFIREMQAIRADVKIIVMSGGGSAKNMAFLKIARDMVGKNGSVVVKPIKPDELMNAVKSIFTP